jgi:anti-sigma B factor antagonist
METFRIRAVPGDGTCTLVLTGEADLQVAEDIVELGTQSLKESSTSSLILDLAAVTFIDSTAIGALVKLRDHAISENKQLVLAGVPDRVHQLLRITGLGDVFTIRDAG